MWYQREILNDPSLNSSSFDGLLKRFFFIVHHVGLLSFSLRALEALG